MARTLRSLLLLLFATALFAPLPAAAQAPPPDVAAPSGPPPAPLPQDKLDALLAPIALYPDQLLGQVLMASTYPLEVVEAARFAEQNRDLKGDALENALKDKTWDPSVISLASFPQVLAMMNDKLEWTQQLGDAFLANEPQVMQTVQTLREKAQAAGNLQSSPQQTVVVKERYIYIEPAQPQTVYVPVYNPTVIYGTWWWPTYRPWYWYPPPYYGYPASFVGVGIAFGAGYALGRYNWGWSNPNWRGGTINVNVNNNYYGNRYRNYNQNGNWQHNVDHRKGVAYRDTTVQNRYQRPASGAGAQTREAYRGYDQNRAGTAGKRNGRTPARRARGRRRWTGHRQARRARRRARVLIGPRRRPTTRGIRARRCSSNRSAARKAGSRCRRPTDRCPRAGAERLVEEAAVAAVVEAVVVAVGGGADETVANPRTREPEKSTMLRPLRLSAALLAAAIAAPASAANTCRAGHDASQIESTADRAAYVRIRGRGKCRVGRGHADGRRKESLRRPRAGQRQAHLHRRQSG